MDKKEAHGIVESIGYVDVAVGNKSLWIEQINDKDDTALVKEVNSDNTYLVPLSQLTKTDNYMDHFLS